MTWIASGSIDNFLYIVMEYLGRNLNDLRRRQPKRRFSPATVLRVCGQMLSALKAVHHIGYLHRDVKPSNMCVGYGDEQSRRNVFLVDFGMTRKFLTDHGERRKERQYAGFRGTMRYVSITVHERREQGPADDMWSLLYSMIEIGEGALPWRHIEDDEDMALKKKKTPIAEMIMHLPKDFKVMADYLSTLTYDSSPNYDFLIGVCKKALGPEITEESPYDWESQFVNSQSLEMDSE
uniref:non-specific serine/threonine protein kinase n=1 Tax=Bursaphelenchus xylophilus TaxID=6326 RepID=A0A1I7S6A1_BURXY